MTIRPGLVAMAAIAMTISIGASAQKGLALAQDEAFVHPHSGIVVPHTLQGLERRSATAFAEDFLNLGLSFGGREEEISVYLYRNTNGAVPVWFSQAQWGIENRDIYKGMTVAVAPYAFPLPGRAGAGLATIYEGDGGTYIRSTGLAMFGVGDWYVKMRSSSSVKSAEQLHVQMLAAIAQLTLPQELMGQDALTVVQDCTKQIKFRKAKDAPKDGASALLGALLGQMVTTGKIESTSVAGVEETTWCRDATLGSNQTAYRANASEERYLLALGDSGTGVSVGPGPSIDGSDLLGGDVRYTPVLHLEDRQVSFVAQNRLPSPARVRELLNKRRVTTTVLTWGETDTIEVSPDVM